MKFALDLPEDENAELRAPAPFLGAALRAATVERCGVVQVTDLASEARSQSSAASPVRREARSKSSASSPLRRSPRKHARASPTSPRMRQRFRLQVSGTLCPHSLHSLLLTVAATIPSFEALLTIENRTGGYSLSFVTVWLFLSFAFVTSSSLPNSFSN